MLIVHHCIDAEAWCRNIVDGGLASLGMCACLVDETDNRVVRELHTTLINIRWPHGPVTDHETNVLWAKYPAACARIQQNQHDPVTAAIIMNNDIITTREIAMRNGWGYRVVLDNPAFDLVWLDMFMCKFAPSTYLPFRHHHITGYIHDIIDVAQRKRTLSDLGIDLRLDEFRPSVPHDHTPDHDARCTIDEWLHLRKIIASVRLKMKKYAN